MALLWFAVLAAITTSALTLGGTSSDAFRIPGTPAQQAINVLGERFPEAIAAGATARVVLVAPAGAKITDPVNAQAVAAAVDDLRKAPKVVAVTDPFETRSVNPAQTMAFALISYSVQTADLTDADRLALLDAVARAGAGPLQAQAGGDAFAPQPETGIGEVIGVSVAAIVLVVTFGSLVAAGVPLLTALLGIGIVLAGITTATDFLDLSSNTPNLALMIALVVVEATAGAAVAPIAGQVAQRIQALPGVLAVAGLTPNPAGDTAIVTVIPKSAPSAAATQTMVRDIRALDGTVPGTDVGVTGVAAINIDISKKLREDFVHGASAKAAVVSGFGHGARVVTAAAIITIRVFFGFVTSPQSFIKSIGFSLGVAIALDAFVVRMTIVPAVMTLLGRSAWWLPRWLDRLLLDLDIEGEKRRHTLDGGPAVRSDDAVPISTR